MEFMYVIQAHLVLKEVAPNAKRSSSLGNILEIKRTLEDLKIGVIEQMKGIILKPKKYCKQTLTRGAKRNKLNMEHATLI